MIGAIAYSGRERKKLTYQKVIRTPFATEKTLLVLQYTSGPIFLPMEALRHFTTSPSNQMDFVAATCANGTKIPAHILHQMVLRLLLTKIAPATYAQASIGVKQSGQLFFQIR